MSEPKGPADPASDVAARPSTAFQLTARMLRLAWRYRRASVQVVGLNAILVAFMVSGLGLTGLGIDYVRHQVNPSSPVPKWPLGFAPPADWLPMQVVVAIAATVLGLAVVGTGLRYMTAVASARLSQRVLVGLRSEVYNKLQHLSFRFFDANPSSSLINRAAGDVQAVRAFVDGVIVKVLVVVLTLGFYLGYMLSVHVPLTIVSLMTSPLLCYGAVMFSRIVQPAYRRASELVDDLVLTLVESIQGIHVVKGFARERQHIELFHQANARVLAQKQSIFWKISTFQPLMGFLTQLNMLVLIGYGGYLVVHREVQLGSGLFVFANLLHEFANQVSQITNITNTIQTSLTGAQRVFEVLDAPTEIKSPPDAVRLPNCRGHVRFEDVGFAYRPQEPILQDVAFEVRPGQCLGIAGETGAGKSSVLSLLARFYDVSSGGVLVDGVDVRKLDVEDLRRHIGIVFQESFLFSNTVAANIAFGHPEAGQDEIERAARMASAHDFVMELPDGYETMVGEYGSNLSGGQRQRLALARALLRNPPILLLDDVTASVDPETEHEIRQAMQGVMRERTTLLVSNRISTLRHADRILVFAKGRIVQDGTHDELIRASGPYRRLAELQFADLADEISTDSGDKHRKLTAAREPCP